MKTGIRSLYNDGGAAGGDVGAGAGNGGGQQSPLGGAAGGDAGGGASGTPAAQLPSGALWSDHRFIEALPADLKADPIIGKYAKGGFEGFARTFVSAQKMIGKDPNRMVELPDGAPDMAFVTGLSKRLGLPEDVKGYKLEAVKDAPAWTAPTTPFSQALVASAHKNGILPAQFQGFFNDVVPLLAGAEKEQAAAKTKRAEGGLAAIDKEWGQAKDAKLKAANGAIVKVGGKDADALRQELIEAGLDTSPTVLKFLAAVGELVGEEDNAGDGNGGGSDNFGGTMPPAEAKARGTELLAQAMNAKTPAERRRLNGEAQKYFAMGTPKKGQKVA